MNNENNWMKLPHSDKAKNLKLWQRMENYARILDMIDTPVIAVTGMREFAKEVKALEERT